MTSLVLEILLMVLLQPSKAYQRKILHSPEGIRLALVQKKSGRKVEMMVEEMDVMQARLFSLLDLGKFMQN